MQLKNVFLKKCTTLIMVIRFAPNKNNQKVVEEQAACYYVKIYLINLKVSTICTVQQYPNVINCHDGKFRPV